jgi:hypothetical protein
MDKKIERMKLVVELRTAKLNKLSLLKVENNQIQPKAGIEKPGILSRIASFLGLRSDFGAAAKKTDKLFQEFRAQVKIYERDRADYPTLHKTFQRVGQEVMLYVGPRSDRFSS